MKKPMLVAAMLLLLLFAGTAVIAWGYDRYVTELPVDIEAFLGTDEDIPPPAPIPASPQEVAGQPKDVSALGGYNVLIADRGNNRVLEVTPGKQVVWEYRFPGLKRGGFGADDAFFTDNGNTIIVNLERYHLIQQIDYKTKQVIWQYGTPGKPGAKLGYLNSPDDAYKLPNGNVLVADIKNCRIIEITPDKQIAQQFGRTGRCTHAPGNLSAPNGDTPLPNGHILVSTIVDHRVTELDADGNVLSSMAVPLKYPSDPQLTKAGNILVADYQNPGKIIEITREGSIVWEYDGENGVRLNDPSLAIELPNGNILSNDDINHRVIVIDKQSKKIVWQFGVTRKPGNGSAQLNIPDGVDIIPTGMHPLNAPQPSAVGAVSRHAVLHIGQQVIVQGYLLKRESGYVIISDETGGRITRYDLPVTGPGIDALVSGKKYSFAGTFMDHGLTASNGSKDHLELSAPPAPVI